MDGHGRYCLHGSFQTRVALACQRCFAPVTVVLAGDIALAVVPENDEGRDLPAALDPLPVADSVALAALVEDEILLALPPMPVHADPAVCRQHGYTAPEQPSAGPDEGRQQPFAGLADLLARNRDEE